MEIGFDDETRVQKLIMKVRSAHRRPVSAARAPFAASDLFPCTPWQSEWLRDAFNELDPSSEKVAFMFSPSENAPMPYNRFASSNRRRTGRDAGGGEDDEELEVPPIFRLEAIGTLGSTEVRWSWL